MYRYTYISSIFAGPSCPPTIIIIIIITIITINSIMIIIRIIIIIIIIVLVWLPHQPVGHKFAPTLSREGEAKWRQGG